MNNTTDARRVLRIACIVAVLLSLTVVIFGLRDSYTRGKLQPLVGIGLLAVCVSATGLLQGSRTK